MKPRRTPRPAAAGGRPRSQRGRRAILGAASDPFEKGGDPAATIEAIAAPSGVAKRNVERTRRHKSVTRSGIGASEEARPAVGRPRSARAHQSVLDAALVLFQEGGYPAVTIEAVAARSGVAKTTIYRSWPRRATFMVELLLKLAGEAAPPPSGSDPIQALRTELHLVAKAADALPGRMLMALLGEAQNDPEVRDALREGLFNPRRRATGEVIRKAQEQGAIRGNVSPLLAVDLIFGPLFYRRFLRQEPATDEFLKQTFELALAGLAPRSAPTGTARTRPRRRVPRR